MRREFDQNLVEIWSSRLVNINVLIKIPYGQADSKRKEINPGDIMIYVPLDIRDDFSKLATLI